MGSKAITSLMFGINEELSKPVNEQNQEYIKELRSQIAKESGKSSFGIQSSTNQNTRKKRKRH